MRDRKPPGAVRPPQPRAGSGGSRGAQQAGPPADRATNYLPVESAGEASAEQAELDAAAAWLAHVLAGRIGGA